MPVPPGPQAESPAQVVREEPTRRDGRNWIRRQPFVTVWPVDDERLYCDVRVCCYPGRMGLGALSRGRPDPHRVQACQQQCPEVEPPEPCRGARQGQPDRPGCQGAHRLHRCRGSQGRPRLQAARPAKGSELSAQSGGRTVLMAPTCLLRASDCSGAHRRRLMLATCSIVARADRVPAGHLKLGDQGTNSSGVDLAPALTVHCDPRVLPAAGGNERLDAARAHPRRQPLLLR